LQGSSMARVTCWGNIGMAIDDTGGAYAPDARHPELRTCSGGRADGRTMGREQ